MGPAQLTTLIHICWYRFIEALSPAFSASVHLHTAGNHAKPVYTGTSTPGRLSDSFHTALNALKAQCIGVCPIKRKKLHSCSPALTTRRLSRYM